MTRRRSLFLAAAVAAGMPLPGGDPIRTGSVAFFDSLRTALLPLPFIDNIDLLLIDVTWCQGIFVFVVATVTMLPFAGTTQGWFLTRCKAFEIAAPLLVAFTLFRPGFWTDMIRPPYTEREPARIFEVVEHLPPGEELRLRVRGVDGVGEPMESVALLRLPDGADARERLGNAGLFLRVEDGRVIVDDATFGSPAKKAGLDRDQEILVVYEPRPQPSKYRMDLPAFALLGLVVWMQRRRIARAGAAAPVPAK